MDTSDIKRVVAEITSEVAACNGDFAQISKLKSRGLSRYKGFQTKYPKLYDMCLDPDFEHDQFHFLMSRLDDIHTKQKTFEESTQQVCDALNEKYVIPLCGSPTRKDAGADNMDHIQFNVTSADGSVSSVKRAAYK